MNNYLIQQQIINALVEDIGDGDHTSLASIPKDHNGSAELKIKDQGILAGVDMAQLVFQTINPAIKFNKIIADGSFVQHGQIAFEVEGNTQDLLLGERLALNIMQRMSGIATYTNQLVQMVQPYNTQLLDTRKTTPNFRIFEKMAVAIGGGGNHRFGLFDMVMLKDNHIDFCGGITNAIQRVHTYFNEVNKKLPIIIETRSLKDVEEVLKTGGVDRIMLDNFTPQQITEALLLINDEYPTEASGGITETTLVEYAQTGVDFISIGALTRDAKTLDLSLKAKK